MLKINCMPLGDYQTNCYIIREAGSKTCALIDPGYQPQAVLNQLEKMGLELEAILLTHGHFDHVGAVKELAAETGCRVYLCQEDLSMPPAFTAGTLYYTDLYGEGDTLQLAGLNIRVLHTPGHTPGSVCLLTENAMFSGDTLFAGSCGRTDLPGGSWEQLESSLARLNRIAQEYHVFPGHGPQTTLSREKSSNPYLR